MRAVSMFLIASFMIFQIGPFSTGVVLGQELPATPSSSEHRLQEILRNIPAEVERYSNLNGEADPFSSISIPSKETSTSSQSEKDQLRAQVGLSRPGSPIEVLLLNGEKHKGNLAEVTKEGFSIIIQDVVERAFTFDEVESVDIKSKLTGGNKFGLSILSVGGILIGGLVILYLSH